MRKSLLRIYHNRDVTFEIDASCHAEDFNVRVTEKIFRKVLMAKLDKVTGKILVK